MNKNYLLIIFGLFSAMALSAQQRVTGTVTSSEDGTGLPGVSVLQKGTTNGTITDADGNYSLEVPSDATLAYSSIGYLSQEIPVNGRSVIDITMEYDVTELGEVVVVGYGTTTRKDLTTSISKVDPTQVSKAANANINDLLVGRAPGLRVTQESAQPGGNINLTIRGRDENPLIVVDGVLVPYSGLEPGVNFSEINNVNRGGLAGLNPSDIESIEVLKDGAASMYGIGAAGGVILITTKKGKKGERINVGYNASHSFQRNYPYIEPLGPVEYMQHFNRYTQDLYLSDSSMVPFGPRPAVGVPMPFSQADMDAAAAAGATDWVDFVLRDGSVDNHSVSISGGTEKVTYYFSGNYFNQVGTVENSEMRKFNGRADLSFQLADFLKVSTNIIANRNNFLNTVAGWQTGGAGANGFTALQAALSYPTYLPVRDPNTGELTRFQLRGNPIGLLDMDDETEYNSLYANLSLDFTIIPGKLTAKVLYGNNYENSLRNFFIPSTTNWFDDYRARASLDWRKRQQQTMEAYATFTDDVSDFLNVSVVAGVGQYINDQFGFGLQATEMLDAINTTNVGAGQGVPIVNSDKDKNKKRSYFTRGTFSILDRYILSGSYRYDGYSQFFPDQKYNGFPSASLAWKVSNEPFFSGLSVFDLLKLRASIGTLGNANYNAYGAYTPDGDQVGFDGGQTTFVPYLITRLDNPDLKWQKTVNKTVGLDFGLFNNRISGSLDYFREDVTRMLVEVNAPALSFLGTQFVNGRHQVRDGIELGLNAELISNSDFTWNATANLYNYTHRWEERHEEDDLRAHEGIKDPVNVIYAFETDGILQLGEEAPAWQPENATVAGSPIFVDQNADGTIDSADVKKFNQLPKLSLGFGSNFRYKNFDLSIFFYGQFGAYRNNFSLGWTSSRGIINSESAGTQDMDLIWNSENPDGTLPGISYQESTVAIVNELGVGTDVRVTKADFVRARNITLGYTFTSPAVRNIVSDLRVYIDFQNPFIFTKYKGADPEVAARGVKGAPAPYPMIRTYSVGINANF